MSQPQKGGAPWQCPFCARHVTITDASTHVWQTDLALENADGYRRFTAVFYVCPNAKCHKTTLKAHLHELVPVQNRLSPGALLKSWSLIPNSIAKVYPDYVPQAIRDDYTEACLIRELSPKAAATLARRTLQGMLRDFWCVKAGRLVDEITQIKDKIDPATWDAIEAVRTVGNIGAHMEKDIDLIVDVEPREATLLIELIENLIQDWYVAREERRIRLQQIQELAKDKAKARTTQP